MKRLWLGRFYGACFWLGGYDGAIWIFFQIKGAGGGQDGGEQLQLFAGGEREREVCDGEVCYADDGGVLLCKDTFGGSGESAAAVLPVYG